MQYDRTLLVADNRRTEPKKFGYAYFGLDCGAFLTSEQWARCKSQIPKVVPLRMGMYGWGLGSGTVFYVAFTMEGFAL